MDGWLLADARDRDWGDRSIKPGCSQLVCALCGAAVRTWPGWALDRLSAPEAARALHVSGDVAALPGALPRGHVRLYACTCRVAQATTHRVTRGAWTDDMDGGLPWGCSGHPRPTDAALVHGIDLSWPAHHAVDAALSAAPLPGPSSRRWHLLAHLYGLFADSPVADALARELASRLDRIAEPAALRCAWAFFVHHPNAAGAERCGPAFLQIRDFLAATPDPVDDDGRLLARAADTLTARLRIRDSSGQPVDRAAVEGLGQAILIGEDPLLAYALGEAEPAWLVGHAVEFLIRWPDRLKLLLVALGGRGGSLRAALQRWAGSDERRWARIWQCKALLAPEDRDMLAGLA